MRVPPRRGLLGRLLSLLLLLALPALAEEPAKPPAPPPAVGVTVVPAAGARRVDAVVPGRLLAAALPLGADGRRRIVLLVGPDLPAGAPAGTPEGAEPPEGPRRLFLLDTAGQGRLRPLLEGLPKEANELDSFDLDGDGSSEVLLGEPGKLYSLGSPDAPTPPRLLLSDPAFDLRRPTVGGAFGAAEVGKLRTWALDGKGGLAPGLEYELPVRAAREQTGLRLSSPAVRVLPHAAGSPPVYAAGPEPRGKVRLSTLLLDRGEDGEARKVEVWSQLPAPEEVATHEYVLLDGVPALIVTTTSAEKMSVFEKKKLRIFPLKRAADRSRSGQPPALAVQTVSYRWHSVVPYVLDADRDGHDDLIVVQPDGLAGRELVVETWFGQGGGRFQTPSRKQKYEMETRTWAYGRDLTGDGVPDLAAVQGDRLLVFAGTRTPRQTLLEREPRQTVELGPGQERVLISVGIGLETGSLDVRRSAASLASPRVIDLDADRRAETLFFTASDGGRGRVAVVRLN
ncbi:MAG TPA: VCBS repeat-containing protein [Thermoanaerobaculia bacterium]